VIAFIREGWLYWALNLPGSLLAGCASVGHGLVEGSLIFAASFVFWAYLFLVRGVEP
jgi:hypothetical protein